LIGYPYYDNTSMTHLRLDWVPLLWQY